MHHPDATSGTYTGQRLRAFVLFVAVLTVCIGTVVLSGWLFDISALTSLFLPFVGMKANTAVGFIFAGLSLGLCVKKDRSSRAIFFSMLFAGLTTLIALLALGQYFWGVDFGIDRLVFHVTSRFVEPPLDGRMALLTAVSLLFLGSALLAATFPRLINTSQWLSLPVGLIGVLALTTYHYGVEGLVANGYSYILMAIPTAFLFILLSPAVFLLHPEHGLARMVTSDDLGGWVFRRLFPVVTVTPLIVGWFQILGEHSGYFSSAFRIAFMMVLMIPVAGVSLWYAARGLDRLNTARRRVEQVMQENEQSYHNQFADNSVVMLMIDPADGAIVDANTAAQKFYGYTLEQLTSMRVTDINVMPEREVRQAWETVQQGKGGRFEFKHRLADGSLRYVSVSTSRVRFGERMVLHSIINDITDQKLAEEARRESEEQYRLLTENAYSAIASHQIVFDEKGRAVDYIFLGANRAFETQTGLRASDIIGRRVTEVLPGIEDTLFLAIYGQVVRTGDPISFEQHSEPLGRHYAVTAYSLGNGRFATQFTDITERKKAEESLRKREAFLNQLLEMIPTPVFSTDRDGRYVLVNKAFATLFWRSKADILGKNVFDLFPPEIANDDQVENAKLLQAPGVLANYSKMQDGLGVMHDVIFRKATLTDEKGEPIGLIGAILDITDFKRMEDELDKTTRMLEKASKKGSPKAP